MENFIKYAFGVLASIFGLLAPIQPLILCAVIFIGVDFITGVIASRKRAKRACEPWGFESGKAWMTVVKLGFVMAGIILAWMIDTYILVFMTLNLANIFTGFVCGVEFWSYLENAAEVSNHPVFRGLRKVMKSKMEDALGTCDKSLNPNNHD